jgi:hypothetical protein
MTLRRHLGLLVAALGLMLTAPVLAHHGFETEYDRNKSVKLTGVVTTIAWTFPHMRVYVDVTDGKGVVTNWNLEMGTPNDYTRQGWRRNHLLPGEKVVFEAFGGIVVESRGQLRSITKVGETKPLFSGNAPGFDPEKAGALP